MFIGNLISLHGSRSASCCIRATGESTAAGGCRRGLPQSPGGRHYSGAGGVLVDERVNGSYDVSFTFSVAQGLGHDTEVGLGEDETGNDRCRDGTLFRGAATSDSLGILLKGSGKDGFQFLEDSRDRGIGLVLELGNVTRHGFNVQVFQENLCKRPL